MEVLPLHSGCNPACPACRHRTWPLSDSLAQKQVFLNRMLEPWAERLAPVASVDEGSRWGYRRRCTLHLRWEQGWQAGLLHRDDFIPIPDCPVQDPEVNATAKTLLQLLPSPSIVQAAFYVQSGRQVVLVLKQKALDPDARQSLLTAVQAAWLGLEIDGLWLHYFPSAGRRVLADSGWDLLFGSPQSRDEEGLLYGPAAFAQLLPGLHAQALDQMLAFLAPRPGYAVLDLYCGAGRSLQRFTHAGARALGIELGGDAIACARLNAPEAEVLRGTCAQRLPQIRTWWDALDSDARLAYANPPRTGLEPELLQYLAEEARPVRLAYLSCSAGTLRRDLAELTDKGYAVKALLPFDFFPQTHHVETLALLRRY